MLPGGGLDHEVPAAKRQLQHRAPLGRVGCIPPPPPGALAVSGHARRGSAYRIPLLAQPGQPLVERSHRGVEDIQLHLATAEPVGELAAQFLGPGDLRVQFRGLHLSLSRSHLGGVRDLGVRQHRDGQLLGVFVQGTLVDRGLTAPLIAAGRVAQVLAPDLAVRVLPVAPRPS